ncbi:MAG: hypothetical protein KF905_17185 [Flavobacteriales bacterium]|nr:hypothetical protein [Flavobacteriales bacterium]
MIESLRCSALVLLFLAPLFATAQSAGSVDLGFLPGDAGYGTGVGGSSHPDGNKVVVLPDGKMMVGGFQVAHNLSATRNVMRLNTDGTVDPTFNMPYDNNARCFAMQPDGKVLVGGVGLLKRFNTDGSPDPSFEDPGALLTPMPGSFVYPEGTVLDLHVLADGSIMASGAFSMVGGAPTCGLVRFTAQGWIDAVADLGYALEQPVHAFVVNETTGKVFATSADFVLPFSPFSTPLVRFNADLSLDVMVTGLLGYIYRMVLQPNGGILFAGDASAWLGSYAVDGIGRLNPDGTLDMSFSPPVLGPGMLYQPMGLAVQADNKAVVGGLFTLVDGAPREYLVRLAPDGSLDNTFDIGLNDPAKVDNEFAHSMISAIAVQADGRIVTAGQTYYFGNRARRGMARFMPDGALDNGFNPSLGASDPVRALVRRPDGRIIVGGDFSAIGDSARGCIAQLLPDGTVDPDFPSGAGVGRAPFADGSVRCMILLPDGRLLVAGRFLRFHGQDVSSVLQLLPDGSLDPAFQPPTVNGIVESMALQPDGRILLGGTMSTVQGEPRRRVARLLPNGALDTDFDPGPGIDPQVSSVNSMLVLPDGRILLGGSFSSYAGVPASNIVRVLATGAIDPTFSASPGANGRVEDMLLMPNGDVMLAGSFTAFNGSTRYNVARLDPDGALTPWIAFGLPAHPQGMRTLALQSDGKLLVGGHASGAGSSPQSSGVVRVLPGGGIDDTFDVGDGFGYMLPGTPFPAVYVLLPDGQGGIIVGGNFTAVDGTGRNFIARLYQGLSVGTAGSDVASALDLFPSPTDGLLHVQLHDRACDRCMLRVLAMDGRVLLEQRMSGAFATLDLQRLPAGTCMLEIVGEDGVHKVQRFVKQ